MKIRIIKTEKLAILEILVIKNKKYLQSYFIKKLNIYISILKISLLLFVMAEHQNCNKSISTKEAETIISQTDIYNTSQSLIDLANNTFQEFCRILECKEIELLALEEKRKKLQEELQKLRTEIECKKQLYKMKLT